MMYGHGYKGYLRTRRHFGINMIGSSAAAASVAASVCFGAGKGSRVSGPYLFMEVVLDTLLAHDKDLVLHKDTLDVRREAVDVLLGDAAKERRLPDAVGAHEAVLVALLQEEVAAFEETREELSASIAGLHHQRRRG